MESNIAKWVYLHKKLTQENSPLPSETSLVNMRILLLGDQLRILFWRHMAFLYGKVTRKQRQEPAFVPQEFFNALCGSGYNAIGRWLEKNLRQSRYLHPLPPQDNHRAKAASIARRIFLEMNPLQGSFDENLHTAQVRQLEMTHLGRIDPVDTPQGQKIGLMLSFAELLQ